MLKLKKKKTNEMAGGVLGGNRGRKGMYSKGQGKAGVTLIPWLKCLLYRMGRKGGRAW